MSEGPTTVGSILAKLGIDTSNWDRQRQEIKGQADELGSLEPKIKVDVNAAEALAKLEAIRAAQEKYGVATDRVRLAYQRLDEVQTKGGASESRLMGLHLAATQAEKAQADALRDLTAAKHDDDDAGKKLASSQQGNLQRWQLIGVAIAALIPLFAPLMAYAVGVAGALAGMATVGVISIFAIRDAIQSGTSAGEQFGAGLAQLNGMFDNLKQTVSDGILSSFNQSINTIGNAFPAINLQMQVFTEYLGRTGNNVLDGVLSALQVLNPLFIQAADYVEQLSVQFKNWTQDGGLQSFANYAVDMLPKVEQMLGSLVNAAFHLIDAFAPLGSVMVQLLTALGDAISGIPSGDLLVLGSAVAAVAIAFNSWQALIPLINNVSSAMGGMKLGAIGLAGGIAVAAAALDGFILAATAAAEAKVQNMFGNTQDVNQWSQAIRQGNIDTGNLGKTLSLVGGFWNDFGNNIDVAGTSSRVFYDNAKRLDTALAQANPQDLVKGYQQLIVAGAKVGKTQQDIADIFPQATAAYLNNKQAVQDQAQATQQATDEQQAIADALGITISQLDTLTNSNNSAKTATDLLKQSLDLLNGKSLSAAQAQNNFDSAIANSDKHVDAAGKTINRANTSLDGLSAAAVKNRSELVNQTQAAEANSQAFRDNGASAEATRQKLIDMKKEIVDNAVAHGEDRAAVQAYVDTIYKIPAEVPPTKLEVEAANALAVLQMVHDRIAGIQRSIVITIQANGTSGLATQAGQKLAFADGGTVGGSGGPKSDRIGIWASPGEEIIQNPQAGQFRPVLKAINNGDAAGARAALGGGGKSVVNNFHIYEAANGDAVAQKTAHLLASQGV